VIKKPAEATAFQKRANALEEAAKQLSR
jgi:hypothetical protein